MINQAKVPLLLTAAVGAGIAGGNPASADAPSTANPAVTQTVTLPGDRVETGTSSAEAPQAQQTPQNDEAAAAKAKARAERTVKLDAAIKSRDNNAILGLGPNATKADVKLAYRNLAKDHHPDINKDPKSAERFRAVHAAYEEAYAAAPETTYSASTNRSGSKYSYTGYGHSPSPSAGFPFTPSTRDSVRKAANANMASDSKKEEAVKEETPGVKPQAPPGFVAVRVRTYEEVKSAKVVGVVEREHRVVTVPVITVSEMKENLVQKGWRILKGLVTGNPQGAPQKVEVSQASRVVPVDVMNFYHVTTHHVTATETYVFIPVGKLSEATA